MQLLYGCKVNGICCDLQSALKPKVISVPQISLSMVFGRWMIFRPSSRRRLRFLRSVSAEDHKTVKTELIVSLFHGLNLVQSLLIRNPHQFEWLSGCSENSSALSQDSEKVPGCKHTVFPVDQSLISVIKSINLKVLNAVAQTLYNASHIAFSA